MQFALRQSLEPQSPRYAEPVADFDPSSLPCTYLNGRESTTSTSIPPPSAPDDRSVRSRPPSRDARAIHARGQLADARFRNLASMAATQPLLAIWSGPGRGLSPDH